MMRFRLRIPRFASSTVEAGPTRAEPVLDGRDVVVPNRWQIPPNTVALVGRPAVWFSFDINTPRVRLGSVTIPSKRLVWEQDFGGHLFVAIARDDNARVTIVEAGPSNSNGTGALVPYAYPEDAFADKGVVDFSPIPIKPPNGLAEDYFAELVRTTPRGYDGNQRYLAVEIPFLRVGRDSNSYAIGVLLSCGIDPREIPKPVKALRFEWVGYPGAEDPVHRANFGAYIGAPSELGNDVFEVAYHNADGSVRYVVVGGAPRGRARLPDGHDVVLDAEGRISLAPDEARRHGLPTTHTDPPAQIRARRPYPRKPAAAGAEITLVVDGQSVPLEPGTTHRGRVTRRHDGLGLAWLRTATGEVVLPLAELGLELRDPRRVDRLLRVGTDVTVGLRSDRHPRLVAHGGDWLRDRLRWRQLHLPRVKIAVPILLGSALVIAGLIWLTEEV